jgi:hypothetical protein
MGRAVTIASGRTVCGYLVWRRRDAQKLRDRDRPRSATSKEIEFPSNAAGPILALLGVGQELKNVAQKRAHRK